MKDEATLSSPRCSHCGFQVKNDAPVGAACPSCHRRLGLEDALTPTSSLDEEKERLLSVVGSQAKELERLLSVVGSQAKELERLTHRVAELEAQAKGGTDGA